jgi:hypothetical protein
VLEIIAEFANSGHLNITLGSGRKLQLLLIVKVLVLFIYVELMEEENPITELILEVVIKVKEATEFVIVNLLFVVFIFIFQLLPKTC